MRLPTCRGLDWEDDSEEGGEESEVGEGGGGGGAARGHFPASSRHPGP